MAACGQEDRQNPFSTSDRPSTLDEHESNYTSRPTTTELESRKMLRSQSTSSFDFWPTLLVSKKPPSFFKTIKKRLGK